MDQRETTPSLSDQPQSDLFIASWLKEKMDYYKLSSDPPTQTTHHAYVCAKYKKEVLLRICTR